MGLSEFGLRTNDTLHYQHNYYNRWANQLRIKPITSNGNYVGQFIETASHEFCTPLAAIQSSADLIEQHVNREAATSSTPAIRRHLAVISAKLTALDRLLRDTLTLSQIEAGKTELQLEWTDSVSFIRTLLESTYGPELASHRENCRLFKHSNVRQGSVHEFVLKTGGSERKIIKVREVACNSRPIFIEINVYLAAMSAKFPATYSTLSPAALATLLAQTYDLENVRCAFLVRGVGDTYLVESEQDRFILRIYRSSHRSLAHVQAEVAMLLALKQAGVSVSYPIVDRTKGTIQTIDAIEGQRQAVLFSYAPGQPASILTPNQLRSLGREMARFHRVSSTLTLPGERWVFDLDTTFFHPLERLQPTFGADQEGYDWLRNQATYVVEKLSHVNTAGFMTGYCHFDFLPKNVHFEGESVTLFDFDFMGYGWLINDIMSFWQHLALAVYAGRMSQQACDEAYAFFLEGYGEFGSISDQELALVPYLSLGFWLFYMSFHTTHDQFYSFSQPAHRNVYIGFLRHLVAMYWDKLAD
ncbi:phosphotransferase [Spirosoma linguale]|uniref:histidine kinase n=1 Tax=Spirosoma linguale (strain ATCC 33905 / DSM 74 / LMG 10896 / Claus 1) TaxID=504472 RepID=D2QDJ4_SPILD|nr:aminoglycoside phosphotransferase [Spirosoma linguale DSM 74]